MKRWKIERWSERVRARKTPRYGELAGRELVIVGTAMLDLALVELLAARLAGPEDERVSLLGADEDGRAPCASFGARIQLGVVLGVIGQRPAKTLRGIKALRNYAAHRLDVDFGSMAIRDLVIPILDSFVEPWQASSPARAQFIAWRRKLPDEAVVGHIMRGVFETLEFGLGELAKATKRIEPIVES